MTVLLCRLHRHGSNVDYVAGRIKGPEAELDDDVLCRERTELNMSPYVDVNSDGQRNARPLLDGFHGNVWPLLTNAGNPGGERLGAGGAVCFKGAVGLVRGKIDLARVVSHHAMRVDKGADAPDGSLHALDPFAGHSVRTSIVEKRNDIVLKEVVKGLRFDLVLVVAVIVGLAFADGLTDTNGAV